MRTQTKSQLYIPQGAESLHLDEAFTHREVLRVLEDVYHTWGYLPVQTPVVDYYENYRKYMAPKGNEDTYRLIDREGELLMLRSDITLFLARLMSINLQEESLPVRAYYGDTILRYQPKEDISHNEFFQVGCELVGKEGLDGDLEVLLLLKNQLDSMNLQDYRVHLGSRALFDRICQALDPAVKSSIILSLEDRHLEGIQKGLEEHYDRDFSQQLASLLMFIGDFDGFLAQRDKLASELQELLKDELSHLESMVKTLKELNTQKIFRMDLSEIGSQPYYSGIVFQCYAPGADSAIASGGRYDGLIHCKGKAISSVGFSLMLRKVEALLPPKDIPTPYQVKDDPSFVERYKKAQSLREKGRSVLL